MASIGSAIGLGPGAGAQGLAYRPGEAPIIDAVSKDQAQAAYGQSQTGIDNQAAFLAALQAQNGISNQSAVYNQLQGIANGTGPNPASAMLNNATGANNAATAALMAGQRGSGANTGLIARQAAQQGAANQQNNIGQAAALQAQQSLGAINAAGNIAGNQVANQAAATGAYTGATQSEQQLLLNQIASQNNAQVANQANVNNVNEQQAQGGAKAQSGLIGGAASALMASKGGVVPHPRNFANGGVSLGVDTSNMAAPAPMLPAAVPAGAPVGPPAPKSFVGRTLKGMSGSDGTPGSGQEDALTQSGNQLGSAIGGGIKSLFSKSGGNTTMPDGQVAGSSNNFGAAELTMPELGSSAGLAKGGKVPARVSPGEIYLSPDKAKKVAEGKADPKKVGEKIPGKAKVSGDSEKNDIVKKNLDAGGVVVKRSVALDKDDRKAIDFVKAVMAKSSMR